MSDSSSAQSDDSSDSTDMSLLPACGIGPFRNWSCGLRPAYSPYVNLLPLLAGCCVLLSVDVV